MHRLLMDVVEFAHVYKKYRKNMNNARSVFGYLLKRPSEHDFWALDNLSFTVKRGETLGVIGANGAGKSTLLKILARVTKPTSGTVRVQGKVGALIELGAGFHPELTGRENIYLYGAILGMRRKEIAEKFADIVEFSGLQEFLDTPVKFYSSGMFLRLGFAVTAHMDTDVLLVDEVLAVGDENFQRKCLDRIREFKKQGKTTIVVSHNLPLMENICGQVAWINEGRIKKQGGTKEVINFYKEYVRSREEKDLAEKGKKFQGIGRWGNGQALITEVKILDRKENEKQVFETGEDMAIKLRAEFFEDIKEPIFGFIIYDANGAAVYGTNTRWRDMRVGEFSKNSFVYFLSEQRLNLLEGKYTITVAIADQDSFSIYDWREKVVGFAIANREKVSEGIVELDSRLSILRM